jgi:hypothetical protein
VQECGSSTLPETLCGRLLPCLHNDYAEVLLQMMMMNNDDHVVGTSLWLRGQKPSLSFEHWENKAAEEDGQRRERDSLGFLQSDEKRAKEEARWNEIERTRREKALKGTHENADTLLAVNFEEKKLRRNVASLSTSGTNKLFGRVVSNRIDDRTRLITVQPITLSVA